jgi:hypothetical protein
MEYNATPRRLEHRIYEHKRRRKAPNGKEVAAKLTKPSLELEEKAKGKDS